MTQYELIADDTINGSAAELIAKGDLAEWYKVLPACRGWDDF